MRHDVVLYSASSRSAGRYDRSVAREGGAERQVRLLAQALALRGQRVAQIVPAPREPLHPPYPLTLIHRGDRRTTGRPTDFFSEAIAVWRALAAADARVVIIRTASPVTAVAGIFCRLRRRIFIFSSSNISDFMIEKFPSRFKRLAYYLGVSLAHAIVVQSNDQWALAHEVFGSQRRIVQIPSLAEMAGDESEVSYDPESFLWFGRAVPEKDPMKYVELARSVPNASFIMVATGRSQLAEELQVAASDVPNLVLFGPLSHERLQDVIARSVAVVNTSTLEGMPNAFLEAWAWGVPVLTLHFDPDDVVTRFDLGVAAGGSWTRFVSAARELWESRFERDEIFCRVRSHVERMHGVQTVSDRWGQLIEDLKSHQARREDARYTSILRSLPFRIRRKADV